MHKPLEYQLKLTRPAADSLKEWADRAGGVVWYPGPNSGDPDYQTITLRNVCEITHTNGDLWLFRDRRNEDPVPDEADTFCVNRANFVCFSRREIEEN